MKIEWLVTDVTSVRSRARAERDIFGVIFGVSWAVQTAILVGEPLGDVRIPLEP